MTDLGGLIIVVVVLGEEVDPLDAMRQMLLKVLSIHTGPHTAQIPIPCNKYALRQAEDSELWFCPCCIERIGGQHMQDVCSCLFRATLEGHQKLLVYVQAIKSLFSAQGYLQPVADHVPCCNLLTACCYAQLNQVG